MESHRQVSNRLIRCTLQKTDLVIAYSKSLPQLQSMLHSAFQAYKALDAESLCDDFLPNLAHAQAVYFHTFYESKLQKLLQTEHQYELSRSIKRMRQKLSKPPTTQVYVTENNHVPYPPSHTSQIWHSMHLTPYSPLFIPMLFWHGHTTSLLSSTHQTPSHLSRTICHLIHQQ